jgi:hypothetical protein
MACKPLMIHDAQNETAEVGLKFIGVRSVVSLTVEHTWDGRAVDTIEAGKRQAESSKNRLNLEANRPLLGLGEAGDRQWRGSRDFSTLRIG